VGKVKVVRSRANVHLLCVLAALCLPLSSSASSDPVPDFIVKADSLAKSGEEEAFREFVTSQSALVGAAVGQLLDAGFEVGEAGDAAAEAENVALAERVARVHWETTGSVVPLEIVGIHRGWTRAERAERAKAKALEKKAFEHQRSGDYDAAAPLFEQVLEIARGIDDRRTIAVTWGSLGVVNWYREDMAAVRENYQEALSARRAVEDRILEGKTLNGLGSVCWRLGEYENAIGYYDEAAKCRRETGDMGGLGISLTYKGNCYYQMGRVVEAKQSYEEAYAILEEHGSPQQMIEVLNSIANIYAETGRANRAEAAYREAIEIASTVDRPQDEASCRMNLADNLRVQRRYREALEELDRVPALLQRQPEPEKTVLFLRTRGRTYREMGEYDDARTALLEFLEEAQSLEDPYYHVEALIDLGELYGSLGARERALEMAKQAEKLAVESGNERLLADGYALAGRAEADVGDYVEAIRYRGLAREKNLERGAGGAVLDDDVAIASHRAALGQSAEARSAFYDALPHVREARRKDLEWTIHFGIGHTFEKENPDSAAAHYERAFALMEESREEIGGSETRTGFLTGERRSYFEEVARYFVSLDGDRAGSWSARAFHTIERAKARGLLDLLERTVFAESSPVEDAILDSLYSIAGDTPDLEETKGRLEKRYLAAREARLTTGAGRIDPRQLVVGIDDVRKRLPKKTALLEYALGDTVSLLWVIDKNGFEVFELPNRQELVVDVEGLRDAIQRPGVADAVLREKTRTLYEKLVAPGAERIAKAERLVIVPDGFLFEIPFEALLVDEPASEAGWRDLPYLTRFFDTVYAPSASIFFKMSDDERKRKYGIEVLAFGDPDFSRHATGPAAGLGGLPYSRLEVSKITSHLSPEKKRVFLGADASERELKSAVRSNDASRILHLATHGLVDRADPTASSIVLTSDGGSGEDGYLHALEILSLPLSSGLVVLSACETAVGRINRGEGVVGLSRAFLASGARGVVASLWAVPDESTSDLMAAFYAEMLDKRRPACDALRAARVSLIEDPKHAHPFYWSPFVLIGTADTPW
jgi:CHAT domain-containing protein/Tfp pilus assembly protein PilF